MKGLFGWILMLICAFNFAQTYQGIVYDENYLEVENAQVYFPGTTKVSTTDAQGKFRIEKIPNMNELVVSHPDFSTITIQLSPETTNPIEVVLTQKIELSATVAQAISEQDRLYYLIKFKEILLGNSTNGKNCKIKNEDMIRFYYDKPNKTLTAISLEPLIVVNKNLGYQIRYDLIDFAWNMKNQTSYYAGYPLFIDLYPKAKKRIQKNRTKAFTGSLQHFLQSVYRGDFLEQGFEVRKLIKKRNPNYPSDSAIAQAQKNIKNKSRTFVLEDDEDMRILREARTKNKHISYLLKPLLSQKEIVVERDGMVFLNFEDYLSVEYINEKEPKEYINTLPYNQRKFVKNQTSLLWCTGNVQIVENGLYFPTQNLWTNEYLGFEKLGDMVPADYVEKLE